MTALRRSFLSLLFIGLLILPMAAWANAGSVLFGTVGLLLSLNVVIWLIEGILLCWWFQQRLLPSWGIMFLANLASLAAGNFVIFGHSDFLKHLFMGEDPIRGYPAFEYCILAIAFVLTLMVEWPFCWWLLGDRKQRFSDSLKATGIANAVTYCWLLFMLIPSGGSHSFFGDVQIVAPSELTQTAPTAVIYYVGLDDGAVHSFHLDGSSDETITHTTFQKEDLKLFIHRNSSTQAWDLMVCRDFIQSESEMVKESLLPPNALGNYPKENSPDYGLRYYYPTMILDLRPTTTDTKDDSEKASAPPWEMLNESAFPSVAKSVNILPNGQLVLQLVEQVCLVDPGQKKIAYLTKGRGPLVVLEKDLGGPVVEESTGEVHAEREGH
jgi:hypothetical protein